MKKHYFLGLAAGRKGTWRQLFTHGSRKDEAKLKEFLEKKYDGEAMLCKNGRSALTLALKAYFDKGDAILVNGFTCYAVYEAVKAAGMKPVFVDISKRDLNFDTETLESSMILYDSESSSLAPVVTGLASSIAPVVANDSESHKNHARIKGVIIQNTLGNPVDMKMVEKFAKKHQLAIIEDLAHSTGVKYSDGREAGTVGAATVLSFGKDKSIDTVSGGALILRHPCINAIKAPNKTPHFADYLRERFYPLFGAMCRGLSYVHLGGVAMRSLVKIHFVERSADNRLDVTCKMPKFEAKLALEQLKTLKKSGEGVLREFYLVDDREEVLKELKRAGYYFDGLWYERPVSPMRYYKKVHFDENRCKNATFVAKHIVNLPRYYSKAELTPARRIIERHLIEESGNE